MLVCLPSFSWLRRGRRRRWRGVARRSCRHRWRSFRRRCRCTTPGATETPRCCRSWRAAWRLPSWPSAKRRYENGTTGTPSLVISKPSCLGQQCWRRLSKISLKSRIYIGGIFSAVSPLNSEIMNYLHLLESIKDTIAQEPNRALSGVYNQSRKCTAVENGFWILFQLFQDYIFVFERVWLQQRHSNKWEKKLYWQNMQTKFAQFL